MSTRSMPMIVFAAALALAACQQQSKEPAQEQAPTAMQPAPVPQAKPEAPAMTAKPEASAPAAESTSATKPEAPAMTPKPAPAVAAPAPAKPAASTAMTAKPDTPSPRPVAVSTTAPTFSTTRCMACHAIDHVKIGPAWKDVVAKYGTEDTLAKVFESGFAVKDRKIASSEPKFKSKAGLMTMQYRNLIKGHGKAAAHALFMTVKNGKFGSY